MTRIVLIAFCIMTVVFSMSITTVYQAKTRSQGSSAQPLRYRTSRGVSLTGVFQGLRVEPARQAYFREHAAYWRAAVRRPPCYVRSIKASEHLNPSWIERAKDSIASLFPQIPVVHAQVCYWGLDDASCPSPNCYATFCSADGGCCSCTEAPQQCPDGSYCNSGNLDGC